MTLKGGRLYSAVGRTGLSMMKMMIQGNIKDNRKLF